jgi:aminoglycoside 3-N-acetyltransferase
MGENVTQRDIEIALRVLGLEAGDLCLFHSSLKSFGYVEGGAETVIAAMESVIGPEGTLVAPTLCQVDFFNSYKTWHLDKPSDVGYLTEYFRKLPGAYRSDQATHSVAARGKEARELTWEHSLRGPHISPFGEYAFSDGSPWVKLCEKNGKVLFLGVSMLYFTLKHLVESRYVEWVLDQIEDPERKERALAGIKTFDRESGAWPYYNSVRMQDKLEEAGLLRRTVCGKATLLCVEAKKACDFSLMQLQTCPDEWVREPARTWLRDALGI